MTPMAERKPLPVSPSEVRLQNGLAPVAAAAVLLGDARQRHPVWSLPGESDRGPRSKPRVWQ